MENEKLCEYLSDIGVLLFDNVDLFLNIYSSNNSKQFKSEQEKLKNSLFIYLQKTIKDEKYLNEINNNIIETFYNNQAINKYKILKNFVNILHQKLFSRYNFFIVKISKFIANSTSIKNNGNKNNSDNIIKISENNHENKKTKLKSKKKNKMNKTKKVNQYKNNWYRNINDDGVVQHGFYINNDDCLDKIDNNINYHDVENFENNFNHFKNNNYNFNNRYEEEYLNNYNYPNKIDNYKSSEIPINYYIPKYSTSNTNNYYLEDDQDIKIPFSQNINSNTELSSPYNKNYDFFENQENFEQKVKIKLLNLENEKEINLLNQCPFNPKTNSQRPHGTIPKQIIDNKFEKLYNDSMLNKIKKDEKIKKHFEDLKFRPNLKQTENYVISSTFQERLKNSINLKEKLKNNELIANKENKVYEDKINKKDEKKKSVIDWKKVIKENNEKYKNENKYHYGNMMEKKKKDLENIGNKTNIKNVNNIIIKESLNINNKIENNYNQENQKDNENDNINKNNEINLKENKNEDEKKKDNNEIKKNINENYQSSSIKKLLINNNLLKKDY